MLVFLTEAIGPQTKIDSVAATIKVRAEEAFFSNYAVDGVNPSTGVDGTCVSERVSDAI